MRRRTLTVLCVFGLLLAACSTTAAPDTTLAPIEEPVAPVIEGSTDQRVQAIADTLNFEADTSGAWNRSVVRVTYAEKVNHRGAQEQPNYGIHYIVMITADAGYANQMAIAKEVAGRLFLLTTQHVISANPLVSHAGVQIIEPNAWFVGGWERGGITWYVAVRQDLEAVASQLLSTPEAYLNAAGDGSRISGRWLQDLLNELARLRNP